MRNEERRHAGLSMKCPAEGYFASCLPLSRHSRASLSVPRPYGRGHQLRPSLPYNKKINLSTSRAGQAVGVKEVEDGIWLVSFMNMISAISIWRKKPCSPCRTPSGQKCTYVSGTFCYLRRRDRCIHSRRLRNQQRSPRLAGMR